MYESYYHLIYSNVEEYFENIGIVFEFSQDGDVKAANYFINEVLNPNIQEVNESAKELRQILQSESWIEEKSFQEEFRRIRKTSTVVLVILLINGVLAEISSMFIARRILNQDLQTTLANESAFTSFVGKTLAQKKGKMYTAIFLNLKNFKYVNHMVGNEGGNHLPFQGCLEK